MRKRGASEHFLGRNTKRYQPSLLERVQNGFHTMIRSRAQDRLLSIKVTLFYEELPLPGVGTLSCEVFSSVLVYLFLVK